MVGYNLDYGTSSGSLTQTQNVGNVTDPEYFATALTNGPLAAPASSASGGNGVYAYGSSSSFYHTNGFYSEDDNYFANALTNGPLTAPESSSSGGNGVYS